ncbi:MAG: flagellar brake protein [Proteobacteria bacterium]|nr:flagellar brake protein [Burkholderiales bacterium]
MSTEPARPATSGVAVSAGATSRSDEQADDLSRFLIRSPTQIGQILRAVSEHAEIVTAYFNRGREFVITAIVGVDTPMHTVFLDLGADDSLNAKLLASDRVVLVSAHEKVKVQFTVKSVRATQFEGRPTLAIELPGELLKLQRREFYRVRTGAHEPVRCRLPISARETLELTVFDISVGGIAIHARLPDESSRPGTRFPGATLQIGQDEAFGAELELRNVSEVRLRGADIQRLGLRFVALPEPAQKLIQRYILRLERDRKSRENALGP